MAWEVEARLAEIAEALAAGQEPPVITARQFIGWIDAQRRGAWIVWYLREKLAEHGLVTVPDFESAYIDGQMTFAAAEPEDESDLGSGGDATAGEPVQLDLGPYADPTYRISKLQAANTVPTSVGPQDALSVAVTKMLANDFSQLPVMTTEFNVKGMVSWQSIGSRLALGTEGTTVSDFMDIHVEAASTESLFSVIGLVVKHDYVLVRGADNRIAGIVTASDLSLQFRQLTEPFLLIGEIENHVRRIIGEHFSPDELAQACDPDGPSREVTSVADLAFGEYVRLLQKPERWEKLGLDIDRAIVMDDLDRVREIRNDVMHFDPDGIPDDDLEVLRDFSQFMQRLQELGAT